MLCPMVIYIRRRRKPTDQISLLRRCGISGFEYVSSAFGVCACPFRDAPYPAFSTALMIASGEAVPSTPMEFVRRLTAHEVTPSTLLTAFSTRAWHAAQLIPVTLYCSKVILPF